jgi:hypothetical protein
MITPQDKELLTQKGISEEQIAEQLACFEKGFPYLKLAAAASLEKGILAPAADEQKLYLDAWDAYTRTDKVSEVCSCIRCSEPYVQEFVRISRS